MTINKRKKVGKYRGHRTHGGGGGKKRRGSGSRGGRGMAGSGKRAGTKKQSFWITGKSGFRPRRGTKRPVAITLATLQQQLPRLVAAGKVQLQGKKYVVDVLKLGYDKLLCDGPVTVALEITSGAVSKKAVEKIVAAGGSVPQQKGK